MDKNQFVNLVKELAVKSVLKNVKGSLTEPHPKASEEEHDLSDWYLKLSENDKAYVMKAMEQAVNGSVFRFLSMLDGAYPAEYKGKFHLYYENEGKEVWLNNNKEYLFNIFYKTL